jgi:hypothetical protein
MPGLQDDAPDKLGCGGLENFHKAGLPLPYNVVYKSPLCGPCGRNGLFYRGLTHYS